MFTTMSREGKVIMLCPVAWLGLLSFLVISVEAFSPSALFTRAATSRRHYIIAHPNVPKPTFDIFRSRERDHVILSQSSVGLGTGSSSTASDSSGLNGVTPENMSGAEATDATQLVEQGAVQPQGDLTTKILNGVLLAATFGFAAYTILNIDHGMTRGWTQSEIAMRIPLDNWLNYESSLADRPIFTKTAINVIIYLLGDWLSQTAFSGKNVLDFNAARTLRNGFIGLCFGPLVHEYYQFSDHILPVEGGMWNRLEKILMDQTIYLTVKCSIYISAVGLLQGDDINTVKTNVQTKLPSIVLTAWKFWPLVHLVTYGVIPARHRILWVNCVDLVWNAILATMASQKKEIPEEEIVAEAAIQEASVLESAVFDSDSAPLHYLEAVPLQHVDDFVSVGQGDAVHMQQIVVPHDIKELFFEEHVRDDAVALIMDSSLAAEEENDSLVAGTQSKNGGALS